MPVTSTRLPPWPPRAPTFRLVTVARTPRAQLRSFSATLDDGSCEIPGCTIVGACNYDATANVDDGSCDFFSCLPSGCLNQNACNYDPSAIINDGSCTFPDSGYDCDGNCLLDTDGDGVCDPNEVEGCTDADALNYEADATDDDGSCIAAVEGCQDPTACNYNPAANVDDDSCEFTSCAGCLSPSACNYDANAVYPATCEFPEAGLRLRRQLPRWTPTEMACVTPLKFKVARTLLRATTTGMPRNWMAAAISTLAQAAPTPLAATTTPRPPSMMARATTSLASPSAAPTPRHATTTTRRPTRMALASFTSCAGCTNPVACDYDPRQRSVPNARISLHVWAAQTPMQTTTTPTQPKTAAPASSWDVLFLWPATTTKRPTPTTGAVSTKAVQGV